MKTKILMMSSAALMAAVGVALEFFPHEILSAFDSPATGIAPLFAQLTGALYLGFAMLNWMAKNVLIGGIYARPLAIGNTAHFTIGALALVKYAAATPGAGSVWPLAVVYCVLAAIFGYVFMTHPLKPAGGS